MMKTKDDDDGLTDRSSLIFGITANNELNFWGKNKGAADEYLDTLAENELKDILNKTKNLEDLKKEFDTWLNNNDDNWSLNSPEENKIDSVELTNKELKHIKKLFWDVALVPMMNTSTASTRSAAGGGQNGQKEKS